MKLFKLQNIQFGNILTDIKDYLSNTIGGSTNISQSSVFGQLITIVSGVAHNIMVYLEDAFTEQNKYTASRKKSIFGLAAQSGYQPSLGKSAGVWLRISAKPNSGSGLDAILPDRTRLLCTQNGLYYVIVLDSSVVTLQCDGTHANKYFYAVQGRMETQRFVAEGNSLETFNVQYSGFIDLDYLEVQVNGETYTKKASLYDMNVNTNEFTTAYNPTGGIDIIFGNQRHGKQLNDGDVVDCKYLLHDGISGNIEVDDNTYFVFVEQLKDVEGNDISGNEMFNIKFATIDSVASGSDAEDVSQVSRMIGFNSRSLVLTDTNNFKDALSKYSFVGYNNTYSEAGSLVIKSIVMKNYASKISEGQEYFSLTDDDFLLTDLQKQSIINALETSGQMLAGTSYEIMDMDIAKYALFIYIKLKNDSADKNIISTNIKNTVGKFFGDIESDSYIPKSDIEKIIIDENEDIDGVNIYFLSQKNEEALQNGYYIKKTYKYDASTGTFNIIKKTIPIFSGENPHLGLDEFGNIYLESEDEYPVLSGGWIWKNSKGDEINAQPITIYFT